MTVSLGGYDAYHASPPCLAYTSIAHQWVKKGYDYPRLIDAIRERLRDTGKPYVIENVRGSHLINPIRLSGPMFGLSVIRARLFECSWDMPLILEVRPSGSCRGGQYVGVYGHASLKVDEDYRKWPAAMGINWEMSKAELAQAIPPNYTQFIGKWLINEV